LFNGIVKSQNAKLLPVADPPVSLCGKDFTARKGISDSQSGCELNFAARFVAVEG
jgi:hypothetical protein